MLQLFLIRNAISLLAFIVAVASACVAALAAWTNLQKLRLDLYNRRFDVYSRTLDFYHEISEWNPTELEKSSTSLSDSSELRATQRAFIKASREARFLFGENSEIQKLLEQMHKDTIGIIGYNRDFAPKIAGQTGMVLPAYKEFAERLNRIDESIPLLEKHLSGYLDFHTIGRANKMW